MDQVYFLSGLSAYIYMFKSSSNNNPKLTTKTPKGCYWSHSGVLLLTLTNLTCGYGVYIVHFDQVNADWVSFVFFCPFQKFSEKEYYQT